MYSVPYEITALIARYILVFLSVLVLVRSIVISVSTKDKKIEQTAAKLVLIGTEKEYYLMTDSTVGSSHRCDVQITGENIAKIHVQIYKRDEKWVMCVHSKKNTLLNEIEVTGRVEINSNDILRFGDNDYRFILLNGEKA